MQRAPDSYKGENGKVAIIGGSRFMHGAPLLAASAAEASGADLITVCLPACHEEVAKKTSLNFFVHPFAGDELSEDDTEPILELLASIDVAVLGPGIARTEESLGVLLEIIAGATCALVLDASALQGETLDLVRGKTSVLTPHLAECERMQLTPDTVEAASRTSGAVILLKGQVERIQGPSGRTETVEGGNAGLTVGGTGDVLAGCIAGLVAQGVEPFDAAVTSSKVIKGAGDALQKENGYAYTATDVIAHIPRVLHLLA